jgi:hypothetical protein
MSHGWELDADDPVITEADVGTWSGGDADPAGDAEFAAWLGGLPADIRAEYLSRPSAGPLETEPAGFSRHDAEAGSGIGFSAGGAHDLLPPGPDLAWLAAATDAARAELNESALVGVLCAWQRLTSWAQAGQAAAVMTLVRRREAQARELDRPALAEHASDEVAAALRLTGRSADQLLSTAGGLDRLPGVLAALGRGEIDWPKACLFAGQLTGLPDEDARGIAACLLGRAGGMTTGQLRAALTSAVLAHDPQAAERRRKDARADSGVRHWTETSGNSALAGRELATSDVIQATARLTALARWLRKRGAAEPMDQLRAAVYIALLTGRPVQSLLPGQPPPTPRSTTPGSAPPEDTTPEDTTQGSTTPEDTTPGSATPGSTRPEDTTPGSATPGSTRPEDTTPGGATPGSTRPEDTTPGGATPGSTRPEDTTPGSATPGSTPPENTVPGAAAPPGAAGDGWPQLTGSVNLTMPMSAWLGLTRRPGEVASYGPVDAETCRNLAAAMDPQTRWCVTVTDEAGHAVAHACAPKAPPPPPSPPGPHDSRPPGPEPPPDLPPGPDPASEGQPSGGSSRQSWAAGLANRLQYFETAPCSHARQSAGYKPSPSLRHLIEIRQRRCSYTGCRRPAVHCDLDHTIPYDKGGRTCECDLGPACRRHHRAKQAPRWHLTQDQPGQMTWRLPHDREYQTAGEPYPI